MTGEDERAAALQKHLARMRFGEPTLPLDKDEAIERAAELHALGLSYRTVALVMVIYHDWHYTKWGWRYLIEQAGAAVRR